VSRLLQKNLLRHLRLLYVKVLQAKLIFRKRLTSPEVGRFYFPESDLSPIGLLDTDYDLTVYIPTKGRPANALRLQEQFTKTATLNTRPHFILSDNDSKLSEYRGLNHYTIVSPQKPGFVDPLNMGYLEDRRYHYSYAVGFMGDDHLPCTVGWDQVIVNKLQELKAGFVYGNDKLQGEKIPTQIFMTSDIPITLGFMTLPRLKHLYADNFWLDLGKAVDKIVYLPDVIIEHLHPAAGKAVYDAGYEFSGAHALDQEDKLEYNKYLTEDLENDVRLIKGMLRRTGKL
jgi:hypothetical protein